MAPPLLVGAGEVDEFECQKSSLTLNGVLVMVRSRQLMKGAYCLWLIFWFVALEVNVGG